MMKCLRKLMHKIFQRKSVEPNQQYVHIACKGWGLVVSHYSLMSKRKEWFYEMELITCQLANPDIEEDRLNTLIQRSEHLEFLLRKSDTDIEAYAEELEEMLQTYQD